MAVFDVVLALLALFFVCSFLTIICKVNSGLAPLCTLASIATLLTVGGTLGVLVQTCVLIYVLSAVLGAIAIYSAANGCVGMQVFMRKKSISAENDLPLATAKQTIGALLFTPGMVAFWVLTISFLCYFAARKPLFSDFDEYSLWGTASKMMSTQNVLYTEGNIGWEWQGSQNVGLMCLSYFVQFFGTFAPWKTYLIYDVLLFACFVAVIAKLKWTDYSVAVPIMAICWVAPFLFSVYMRTIYLWPVYLSAYGDIPAGIVFGATVVFWLGLRATKSPYWSVLPVLCLGANIKVNTFVLSLAAAGIIAADCILFVEHATTFKSWCEGIFVRIGKAVLAFVMPVIMYLNWNRYIAMLVAQNAQQGGMGETSENLVTVAINGLKMLFGLPVSDYYAQRSERYDTAVADMIEAFLHSKITAFGSGLVVVCLLCAVLAIAVFCAPTAREKLRTVGFGTLCAVCFLAYNFMLVLSYAFVFTPAQGAQLIDYNRYLYTYYLGWLLIVLCLVCLAIQKGHMAVLGKSAVLLLSVVFVLYFNRYIGKEMSILGYTDAEYTQERLHEEQGAALIAQIEADPNRTGATEAQRVFFVSQGDNGEKWFQFSYMILPLVLDYSGIRDYGAGGGTFGLAEYNDGRLYYHEYTPELFETTVLKSTCSYIYVHENDAIFTDSYKALFSDNLTAAQEAPALYRVTEDGFLLVETKEAV